jgi:hypothetical protein
MGALEAPHPHKNLKFILIIIWEAVYVRSSIRIIRAGAWVLRRMPSPVPKIHILSPSPRDFLISQITGGSRRKRNPFRVDAKTWGRVGQGEAPSRHTAKVYAKGGGIDQKLVKRSAKNSSRRREMRGVRKTRIFRFVRRSAFIDLTQSK